MQTCRTRHVKGKRCLFFRSYLVKIADNFVEEPQTLEALLVDVVLVVELLVVGDGREHHGDVLVPLVVQLLRREFIKAVLYLIQTNHGTNATAF